MVEPLQTLKKSHPRSSNWLSHWVYPHFLMLKSLLNLTKLSWFKRSLRWVLRGKETFACVIFGKVYYVACTINCAGKLIFSECLPVWMQLHGSHWQVCKNTTWFSQDIHKNCNHPVNMQAFLRKILYVSFT